MNHTRFPKENHLPNWAHRGNKNTNGDLVEYVITDTEYTLTRKYHLSACPLYIAGSLLAALTSRHTHTHSDWTFPAATSLANLSQCLQGGGVWEINYSGYVGGLARAVHHMFMKISCRILLRMRNVSDKSCRKNHKTYYFCVQWYKIDAAYEIMWKYLVETDRPQM